jgi:acetate kinase
MRAILVVNAGSSSLKFQVFDISDPGAFVCAVRGQVDGIGTRPRLRAAKPSGEKLIEQTYDPQQVKDVPAATQTTAEWLRTLQGFELAAVGHRVVHGGPDYDQPVLLSPEIVTKLERYVPLAPLHQPNNLAPIRTIMMARPGVPQVACFDTAFHRNHDPLADRYAIPENLYAEGVRRYGFHGLSYEYIAEQLWAVAPDIADKRVIVAHLGSGCSMCALRGGRSVESTMGFTALDGLPMGTRPGQIDPGVVLYLIEQKGMSAADVQKMLYHDCGLKGLSGVSNDVRELQNSSDPRASFALDYFAYRVGLNAGMLAAALGGLDAFVFTAGVGENSPSMRSRIVERLKWLGAVVDSAANSSRDILISSRHSEIGLYVVPTNEELMIARHTLAVLSKQADRAGAEPRALT